MKRTTTLFPLSLSIACAAQVPMGPDAPDLAITTDGTALYFTLTNPPGSNNENAMYVESFLPMDPTDDPFWRFQGYVLYELAASDADDSLALVVLDPDRAQPIGYTDVADGITSAWNNFIIGTDSCSAAEWEFEDDGPVPTMASSVSALTGEPWHTDSTYCFLALAFATTPHFVDVECGTEQTMLFSRQSTSGALQVQCVTPATVGITEQAPLGMSLWPNPATEVLHIRTRGAGTRTATCTDAQGRVILQQRLNAEDAFGVGELSAGVYQIHVRAENGQVLTDRFVVDAAGR